MEKKNIYSELKDKIKNRENKEKNINTEEIIEKENPSNKEKENNTNQENSENTEIENLKKQLEEEKNNYLRCIADFDNYRKRVEKEKQEIRERAVINFIENLLPAIDNFEMSLKMTQNTQMFIKGVEMIHKNLLDTLQDHKIESFEPKIGEPFDPLLHEPILIEDQNAEEGKVLGVIKKGFKHNQIIVRPAKVQVKKVEQTSQEEFIDTQINEDKEIDQKEK